MNRLKKGIYAEPNTSIPQNDYYNETLDYDLNGNISSLKRNRKLDNIGLQLMDNLNYVYAGNQLNTVTDICGNYFGYPDSSGNLIHYDVNGNMTDHVDKGILELKYNYLNLPNYIKFDQFVIRDDPFGFGLETKYKNTTYLYRADGVKLKKVHNYFSGRTQADASTTTEYLDGFQYSGESSSSGFPTFSLQFVPTAEGYFDFVQNKYIYHYKDQVGNIRLAFFKKDNSVNPAIDRTTDFYPFGLEFGGDINISGSMSPNYTYNFQEQEKQQDTGWSSFKWRNYDATMGRFFNADPLSEKYSYQSHYNFSENRVVDGRELEGLEAIPADNFNKNQRTLVVLGLGRADGRNGDGVGNGTNTLYSGLAKNLQTDGALATLQNKLGSNFAVATYTGTDSGLAATNMVETISNYKSVNPNGKVIMIGHSLGGKDVLNAASSSKEAINLVLTMEPVSVNAGGGTAWSGTPYSVSLGSNVQNVISLSAEPNQFSGGKGIITTSNQNGVSGTMPGTTHTDIDDSITPYLVPLINRTDQGVNPVQWFKNIDWSKFQVQPNVRTGQQNNEGTGTGS